MRRYKTMRKQPKNDTLLNFETGATDSGSVEKFRQAQARLYGIDNPYVGNKRGIIVDIAEAFEKNDVQFDSILDLFSGSGVVGIFFKLIGKRVMSNDLLTSSFLNALAFVENNTVSLTTEEIVFLCTNNNPNQKKFVQEVWGDRFTPEEAQFLDNYHANAITISERDNTQWASNRYAVAMVMMQNYVMSHCFLGGRLNKGQILAKLEHRLEHDRNATRDPNATDEMKFNLKQIPLFESDVEHRAVNRNACDALKGLEWIPDLCYIDPPYGQAQSDYAQMFAFCEEYVHGKKLSEMEHLQSSKKFCDKKSYENNFREVLNAAGQIKTWAVSFNASSFKSAQGIISILKDYKKSVEVVDLDHKYRYRKNRGSAVEYLFIAR